MLTREGARERLSRFRETLGGDIEAALICRPEHLLYLGNFYPLPNSLNLHGSGYLLIERDGPCTLFTDNWLAGDAVEAPPGDSSPVDLVLSATWYDCVKPAVPRAGAVASLVNETLEKKKINRLAAETSFLPRQAAACVDSVIDCEPTLLSMRERKYPDEIEAIRKGVRTAEAVHSASRELLEPGLREIDYYAQLVARATSEAETPFVMMCDLASGERAAGGGGAPGERVIDEGDLVILDIFPYVEGYRGDITNTLVAGGNPTGEQADLFELVASSLEKAEALLKPGTPAAAFSEAIIETFSAAGEELVHHAGHAIGLGHPEAPELVLESDRIIESGMVLTLEPGVYGKPSGGIRLEHDYLITDEGFERLSNHELGLA